MEFLRNLKHITIKDYITNHRKRIHNNLDKYPPKPVIEIVIKETPKFTNERRVICLLEHVLQHVKTSASGLQYGITNLRITPSNAVYMAQINLGGQEYELADPQTGQFWMTNECRSFPITKNHDITLQLQFSDQLEPVTISCDVIKYDDNQTAIKPCASDVPYEAIETVNSHQHVSSVSGDSAHTPYFGLPLTNGMPLAKLAVRFLDGDNDALSAVWLFTGPADDIHRLSRNSVTGYWELQLDITAAEHELFLPMDTRIQYSRLNSKQPPTKADVRLDTWNLTRVMGGMYGAMF